MIILLVWSGFPHLDVTVVTNCSGCLLLIYQLCGFTTSHQQLNGLLRLCFLSQRKNLILDSKRSMIISLVWSGFPHLDATVVTNCSGGSSIIYQLCGFTTSHQQLNGLAPLCFLSQRKNLILDSKRSKLHTF